jgi:hypothetical protein
MAPIRSTFTRLNEGKEHGHMDGNSLPFDSDDDGPRLVERGEPSKGHESTRFNVRLSPRTRAALEWISNERDISSVEAVRRAITTEKFFLELVARGAKIWVEMPGDKNLKEVMWR